MYYLHIHFFLKFRLTKLLKNKAKISIKRDVKREEKLLLIGIWRKGYSYKTSQYLEICGIHNFCIFDLNTDDVFLKGSGVPSQKLTFAY